MRAPVVILLHRLVITVLTVVVLAVGVVRRPVESAGTTGHFAKATPVEWLFSAPDSLGKKPWSAPNLGPIVGPLAFTGVVIGRPVVSVAAVASLGMAPVAVCCRLQWVGVVELRI